VVQSLELEDGALRGYANDGLTSNHQPFRRESDANPAVILSDITISQKLEGGREVAVADERHRRWISNEVTLFGKLCSG